MPQHLGIKHLKPENPLINKAIEIFSITDDPLKAGYLLADGRFLDLSAGIEERMIDHRDIWQIFPEKIEGDEAAKRFMKETGAIRFGMYHDRIGISVSIGIFEKQLLTSQQINILKKLVKEYKPYGFYLDIFEDNDRPFYRSIYYTRLIDPKPRDIDKLVETIEYYGFE